jgi:hypothetical protein
MERGDPPEHRARVIIVSNRIRDRATGRASSSGATLSLMPRWSSGRAIEMAAEAMKRGERSKVPPGT